MSRRRHAQDLAESVAQDDARLDSRIMRGSAWVAVSYGGRNLVSLLTTLALVRLLEPKAFGLVALAMTVLVIIDQVQNAGAAAALVYRRDDVARAAGSAFVFVVCSSIVLFVLAQIVAPFVADIFRTPDLTNVLRAMAFLLVTRSLGAIPLALLERNIDFRSRSVCELTGALGQAGVSLGLAFSGFGVWSIVLGQIAGSALQSGLAWGVSPLRPDPRLASLPVIRELVRYGRYVSGTNILNIVNNTADNAVIGRVLGATALGFYAVAFRLADFPNTVIAHIVGRVMFPIYSLLQSDVARFRRAFIQNLQRIAVLALPVSVTILVCAEPIVLGLFGSKWEEAVGPLRILAAYGLVKSFTSPGGEVFKGAGRPELGLATGALQVAIVVPALIVLVRTHGVEGGALAMLIAITVCGVLKLALALRLLQGGVIELGRALAPSFLCSGVLCAALLLLMPATDELGPFVRLVVLVAAGAGVYVLATLAFARSIVVPMWVGLRGAGAAR
ncbi:MAG TPA: lipopolysaccharide biosynthesis protein [Gaiellaceae bacterium]|nr:lipopolysaccharide biosynthesis protein [Gaiellaceae bacterium]